MNSNMIKPGHVAGRVLAVWIAALAFAFIPGESRIGCHAPLVFYIQPGLCTPSHAALTL